MKLDKSYKVKVNPEQSREIQELVFKNGGKWESGSRMVKGLDRKYLYILEELEMTCGILDSAFVDCDFKEITAPELIALLSQDEKETKMLTMEDFFKCKKVRCVNVGFNVGLILGKEYEVVEVTSDRIRILNDSGLNWLYQFNRFEPVIETAIQATDSLDSTPMGTGTEFKVGDRVYYPEWSLNICTIKIVNNQVMIVDKNETSLAKLRDLDFILDKNTNTWSYPHNNNCAFLFHATQENYALLSQLYPHIKFEKPPAILQGSDLCRAMLDKGWKYVLCYVDDYSEKIEDLFFRAITKYDKDSFYCEQDGQWIYAVPFDPRTGEILTSEVLDD